MNKITHFIKKAATKRITPIIMKIESWLAIIFFSIFGFDQILFDERKKSEQEHCANCYTEQGQECLYDAHQQESVED